MSFVIQMNLLHLCNIIFPQEVKLCNTCIQWLQTFEIQKRDTTE